MLSPPDVKTSTSLVLSGSGIPGPDAGVGTFAAATAGEAPSPAEQRQSTEGKISSYQMSLSIFSRVAIV